MNFKVETQFIVNLENQPGSIAEVTELLSTHDINIRAISVAEGPDAAGSMRFLPCDPDAAVRSLEAAQLDFQTEEVLSIRLQDSKGKLAFITKALSEAGINIDYVYATVEDEGASSRLVIKVSNIPRASHILSEVATAA